MIVGRIAGWLLLLGAVTGVAVEAIRWWRDGAYAAAALGELWYSLHGNSLVGFGAFVEKSVSPALWQHVLIPLLSWPAWAVLGLPAVALIFFCRRRRRRHKHSFGD